MTDVTERDQWFWDHYEYAANETIAFLRDDGIELEGKIVDDIGSGDGIIDLGIARKAKPAELIGFDLNLTDTDHLMKVSKTQGESGELPACLKFR